MCNERLAPRTAGEVVPTDHRARRQGAFSDVLTQADLARLTAPPRLTVTELTSGSTVGNPGNTAQQRRVIEATLSLLEDDSPTNVLMLGEK